MNILRFSLVAFLLLLSPSAWADSSCSGAKCTTAAIIDTSSSFGAAISYAWLLNENTGTTVASLGTANTGTFTDHGSGTPQWTTNDGGKPAVTNHLNSGGTVNFASTVTMAGAFTVVVRLKHITAVNVDAVPIGATTGNYFLVYNSGTLYVSNANGFNTNAETLSADTWYQFIITRSSGNTITVYKDGTTIGDFSPTTRTGNFLISAFGAYSSGTAPVTAIFDYVIIANGYEATGAEITAINSNPWQYFCETSCAGGAPSVEFMGRRRGQ